MKKDAKKKLYESTVELLKESDYEDLTVGKICQNACLSRQSFYLYYHSKDEILKEIAKFMKNVATRSLNLT